MRIFVDDNEVGNFVMTDLFTASIAHKPVLTIFRTEHNQKYVERIEGNQRKLLT